MSKTSNAILYVLQREDGKFYYKGSTSSWFGFTDKLSDAFLFKTEKGANQRTFVANPMKATVRKVKITLLDD